MTQVLDRKIEETLKNTETVVSFDIEASEDDKKGNILEEKQKVRVWFTYQKTGNQFKDIFLALNNGIENLSSVSAKEKANFFQLLGVMINAGMPIVESLVILSNQTKNIKLKKIILKVSEDIKNGQSFSESMANFTDVFDDAQIGMIKAGEISGRLNNILKDIAKDAENSASMHAKIKGALTYPIVVMSILGLAIILLMTMVIPQIMTLFTSSKMTLPATTRFMIGMSEFFQNHIILIIIAPIFLFVLIRLFKQTKIGKFYLAELGLSLPVFGELNKKASLSRFARTFSNLMKSGIGIVEALQISGNGIGNEVYKRRLLLSAQDVSKGIPLGENLQGDERLFPEMIVGMISIGEKTGEIGNVMEKVAQFYEDEVDLISKNLSKLLEPIIMVIMGLTVGGIVAAIMQPIISLTDIADKL